MKMKKYAVLIVALLAVSAGFAFEAKTTLFGGVTEFSVRKRDFDDKHIGIFYVYPQVGVFVAKDVSLDFFYGFNSIVPTAFGIGLGSRYFHNNLYGGVEFAALLGGWEGNYHVIPKVGYLIPIVPKGYLDLQAYFRQAIDKGSTLGKGYGAIRAGIQVNLERKPKSGQSQ